MKKTILSIAIIGLMGAAAPAWSYTNPTPGMEALEQAAAAQSNDEVTMPVIANSPEATKGLKEFKALMEEYGPALKAQDPAKSAEFGEKMQTWAQGVAVWMPKLAEGDQQKVRTFMQGMVQKYMPQQPAAPATAAPAEPAK
ncbi:hypothetical protein [Taibaiella chishuiensis]|uniref:Uncharacterized protein n=1 Tax=Taibaiella chishuiensis TaxID=1434707 RepID=A0A2P8CVN8_9BACT|nr:hypothetical protein [Taibaiella chishuiensis]PSK89038.1 hypothetical protein B0I18_11350 [Taibaiella chishuiensis]